MLVIDPQACIDCALCEPECPIAAIVSEDDLSESQQALLTLNAELAQQWSELTEAKEPLPDAEEWRDVPDKLKYLER